MNKAKWKQIEQILMLHESVMVGVEYACWLKALAGELKRFPGPVVVTFAD